MFGNKPGNLLEKLNLDNYNSEIQYTNWMNYLIWLIITVCLQVSKSTQILTYTEVYLFVYVSKCSSSFRIYWITTWQKKLKENRCSELHVFEVAVMVASIDFKIRLFLCHITYEFMKESDELLIAFVQEDIYIIRTFRNMYMKPLEERHFYTLI